ncbi:8152_t:CDS:2, partial [Racocetra persica]
MSTLKAKIESLLLEAPLEAVCSASIFYLTMNGNKVDEYDTIRTLANNAVTSVLPKIKDNNQKSQVLKILPQMKDRYNSIVGLNALKALNIKQEDLDYTKEEIDQNIRTLKSRLNSPMTDMTDADVSLYDALLRNIDDLVDVSTLIWEDPIASTVLSDDSK